MAFDFPAGAWNWSWVFFAGLGSATVNTIYTYLGYYHICNLGAEIRQPERNIPARDPAVDRGNRGAVSGDANEHPRRAAVARGAEFAIHREHICRAAIRNARSGVRHRDDPVDRVRIAVHDAAQLFARSLRRRRGRQLLPAYSRASIPPSTSRISRCSSWARRRWRSAYCSGFRASSKRSSPFACWCSSSVRRWA